MPNYNNSSLFLSLVKKIKEKSLELQLTSPSNSHNGQGWSDWALLVIGEHMSFVGKLQQKPPGSHYY